MSERILLFFDCWKISSVVPVFKEVGERSLQLLKKRGLFSDFQYGFRSSRSTAHLLTVASATIATSFNRSVAAGAVALGRVLAGFWQGLTCWSSCTNLSLIKYQVRYLPLFHLFSVMDNCKWLLMGSLHKNTHLMLELLKSLFLVPHFSYYTLSKA